MSDFIKKLCKIFIGLSICIGIIMLGIGIFKIISLDTSWYKFIILGMVTPCISLLLYYPIMIVFKIDENVEKLKEEVKELSKKVRILQNFKNEKKE